MIENALKYCSLGFSVIPIGQDKKPYNLLEWEKYQTSRPTEEEITKWWTQWPDANIGIVCGRVSGLSVLDIDPEANLKNIKIPLTPTVKTGRGWHYYFKYPAGLELGNSIGFRTGMDFKATGGYVIAPPSKHSSGNLYEWSIGLDDCELAEIPEWLLNELQEKNKGTTNWDKVAKGVSEGSRNMTAAQYVGKLLHELSPVFWESVAWEGVKKWNVLNKPPLPERELRTTFDSIAERELRERGKRVSSTEYIEITEAINFSELNNRVMNWYLMKDEGVLKVLMASVIANKLQGDPVWLFLVAASGGIKTELIQSLNLLPEIYPLSVLTPQTLLSGMGKKESLLFRLNEQGKSILAFKDFTTILQMYYQARNDIMAQLREVYDGSYKKDVGARGSENSLHWMGKLGFISGVTPVIDITQGIYSALGERFLQYRIQQPPRKEVTKKVLANTGKMKDIREQFKHSVLSFMSGINIPDELPRLLDEDTETLINLADFTTLARSPVIRDSYVTREIQYKPESEMPTRFIQQVNLIGIAFMIINNGPLEDLDRRILHKLSLDSIPQQRRMVLDYMARNSNKNENTEIATELGYPSNTVRRILEDLATLGITERHKPDKSGSNSSDARADKWTLRDDFRELLLKYSKEEIVPEFKEGDELDNKNPYNSLPF